MLSPHLTTADPQLARALAAITLPSFEELVTLTQRSPRPNAEAPTPALLQAAMQHNDWRGLYQRGSV